MQKTLIFFALFLGAAAFGVKNTRSLSSQPEVTGNLRKAKQVEAATDDSQDDQEDDQSEKSGDVVEEDDSDSDDTAEQPEVVVTDASPSTAPPAEQATPQVSSSASQSDQLAEAITSDMAEKRQSMSKPAAPVVVLKAHKKAAKTTEVAVNKQGNPELQEAKAQVQSAQADLDAFNDDDGFANDNDALQAQLTNETESAALGSMLSKIRSEIRQYAGKASYGPHLEARLEKAEQRVKDLEAEIAAKEAAEKAAAKKKEEEEEEEEAAAEAAAPASPQMTQEEFEQEITNKQHAFSCLLLLLTITQIGIFAMLNTSNVNVKKNTWSVVNTIAVVVIASTLFHVINDLFKEFVEDTHMQIFSHVLYALTIFTIALVGSYKLRNDPIACTAFKAVIFWIVLLAKSGAIGKVQKELGNGPMHTTGINFGCLGFLIVLILITHVLKHKFFESKDKDWYDDVETGLCGGAFGGGIAFLAHIWIDAHFPPDPNPLAFSEQAEANIIAKDVWALITCVLALVLTGPVGNLTTKATGDGNYWLARFWAFINSTVGILPYFAVSLGSGVWISHAMRFDPGSTGAQLISTGVSTFWGLIMILAVSYIGPLRKQANEGGFNVAQLMLGFGGFIAGYAWGALISESIIKLNRGWGWGHHERHAFSIIVGLILNSLAIPVFYYYLAPAVDKASQLKDS